MKCYTCQLKFISDRYFLIYKDEKKLKMGDYLLTQGEFPYDRIWEPFEDGMWYMKFSPQPLKPTPNSIIAALDYQMADHFKSPSNVGKTYYVYEDQYGLVETYDCKILMTQHKTDYQALANQYKPGQVITLLISEAPPSDGESYFYKVPPNYKLDDKSIENDDSLPAAIFSHYFQKQPKDTVEYEAYLQQLKQQGIFYIDLLEAPIDLSCNPDSINELVNKSTINDLKYRIAEHMQNEQNIIFLFSRNGYEAELKKNFPLAQFFTWKDFKTT